jgi:hypothetical protein
VYLSKDYIILLKVFILIKKKVKKMAKWIILSVFILIILSHIHDPIHRHLIDDQLRIWCFVRYSSSMNIYNSSITLIYFLGPFSIHLV